MLRKVGIAYDNSGETLKRLGKIKIFAQPSGTGEHWTCGLIEQVQLRFILRRGLDKIETVAQRNEAFASSRFSADLKIMASMKTMIIGCVDPVDIFGLAPGEAAVIRNVGSRITPARLQTMAMLKITRRDSLTHQDRLFTRFR
jgi:hypothetical protein